jgi:hypothetical protein
MLGTGAAAQSVACRPGADGRCTVATMALPKVEQSLVGGSLAAYRQLVGQSGRSRLLVAVVARRLLSAQSRNVVMSHHAPLWTPPGITLSGRCMASGLTPPPPDTDGVIPTTAAGKHDARCHHGDCSAQRACPGSRSHLELAHECHRGTGRRVQRKGSARTSPITCAGDLVTHSDSGNPLAIDAGKPLGAIAVLRARTAASGSAIIASPLGRCGAV